MGDGARNETFDSDDDAAILGMEADAQGQADASDGMQALEEPSTPTPPPPQTQPVQQQVAPPQTQPAPQRRAIRRAQKPAQQAAPPQTQQAAPQQPTQMAMQPAAQAPAAPAAPAAAPAGALANTGPEHAFAILQSKDMGKMLKAFEDNFGPRGLSVNDLEVITVPSGGATQWQLQTLEGKYVYLEELVVIVVNWSERRAYWPGEFGATKLPQCSSDDTINGRGDPGGPCETCPMSEWGSSEKSENGQACRMTRMLFALCAHDQEQRLPTRIQIPPSSIPGNRQFFAKLATRGVSYYEVVMSLKLTSQGGKRGSYSIVHETAVRRATPTEIAAVTEYRRAILGKLARIAPRNREVMAEQV